MNLDLEKINYIENFMDDCPMLEELENISEFAFAVRHPQISALSKPEFQMLITDHIATEISKIVTEQNLHQLDQIEKTPSENQIDVTYGDDICHFQASLNENTFAVVRKGSTVEEFFKFYKAIVPYIPNLYASTSEIIEAASHIKLIPFSCAYRFGIRLTSFRPAGKSRKKKIYNFELMERLLPVISMHEGPFAELNSDQLARSDVKVSVWKNFGEKHRNCWFDLQAPGNRNWSTLELVFSIQSGTYTDLNGRRFPFDPESINEWDIALIDFFKTLVLNKFMMVWLKDISFSSLT